MFERVEVQNDKENERWFVEARYMLAPVLCRPYSRVPQRLHFEFPSSTPCLCVSVVCFFLPNEAPWDAVQTPRRCL